MSLSVATSLALLAIGAGVARSWPDVPSRDESPRVQRVQLVVEIGALLVGIGLTQASFEDEEGVASVLGGVVAMQLAREAMRLVRPFERARPERATRRADTAPSPMVAPSNAPVAQRSIS